MRTKIALLFFGLFFFRLALSAESINLSKVNVILSKDIKSQVRASALEILRDEIGKRSKISVSAIENWNAAGKYTIALALTSSVQLEGKNLPKPKGSNSPEFQPEGFRIVWEDNVLWIIGADSRAVLFGIGELLRTSLLGKGQFLIDDNLDFASAPRYSLRGHQIGYRNTANSYDAWSVEQYDQYIRDLVLFGTNAIENIPPDGVQDNSPHFKISREEMNVKMSEICEKYDIEYWIWTPATVDLTDPAVRTKELDIHEANYRKVPRLDNIFFPGGDPGNNHPKEVMPFLRDLHARLVKYHPNAGIWISLQGFSQEQVDYFYQYLERHQPTWLRGVVSGPSSPPISETRFRLPKQYKHRHYPDITHNVRCDYPVPNFDQAFALTIGREGINPMPVFYGQVHNKFAPFTDGFVSYSDGAHDDVNKVVWSQRGWDPDKNILDILTAYSRFFFGASLDKKAAEGILGLEKNWDGSIIDNGSIEPTLAYWKNLESGHPQLSGNWRWQMLVMRAYYDAYVRQRKIYETDLEKQANAVLLQYPTLGVEAAMDQALELVNRADSQPIERESRKKIEDYAYALFTTVGLQTSVDKFQASNSQRGCILDFVDYPLNNRWWLADEFEAIRKMESEQQKQDRLQLIANWENPGEGGYYDDVSNISKSPHVTTTVYDAVDFGWWDSGYSRWRLSSQVYQVEPILKYEDLDPNARYLIRVTGFGEALIRIDGKRLEPLVYEKELGGFKEFIVPRDVVGDGKITVSFDRPEESHMRWRNYSRVSDVWLIKR
ncbi:hypothetical protein [Lunatimonas lonarensis]|uniref:hypothetical protein n=1 Tax=Lunatimonas lonarensis TaxID=1232681 RepID=UPI0004B6BAB3|nr:hypothetical protein [Lunatimonas lonarensis]